jgi:hypothetical protein
MTRADARALLKGAAVGAAFAIGVLLIRQAASGPTPFPIAAAVLPSPFVVPTPTPRPELPLTLEPNGLGLVSFGDDTDVTLRELTALLGAPRNDGQWRCAEPAAEVRMVEWVSLSVFFFDGTFVGYLAGLRYPPDLGPPLGLKTVEGLELGATRAELAALYGDRLELRKPEQQFEEDVLEFRIDGDDGVRGIVENADDQSQVISISAGLLCFEGDAPAS